MRATDPVSLPCGGAAGRLQGRYRAAPNSTQTYKDPLCAGIRETNPEAWIRVVETGGIVSAIIFNYLQIGSTLGQSLCLDRYAWARNLPLTGKSLFI